MPEIIAWVVSFVVVTVVVSGVAGRAGWSAPVALVAVGAALSFVPGVPQIEIEPDAVLYGLLPPLLFAAAIRTPLADIRARRDSIVVLSVGVVVVTLLVFGLTLWALVPAVGLAAALALGAVVAPTDAVAVSAVAGRVRLPRRVMSILETESLLNDATALVALNTAIAAIVGIVHPVDVAGGFVVAVLLGVGVGLGVAFLFSAVRRYLRSAVLDTSLSLAIPYVAFIPAQELGGSGVLAVVAAGLVLGYRAPLIQSPEARIAESVNWRTIQFLLENAVFLLIGLSLAGIVRGLPSRASTAGGSRGCRSSCWRCWPRPASSPWRWRRCCSTTGPRASGPAPGAGGPSPPSPPPASAAWSRSPPRSCCRRRRPSGSCSSSSPS
ncbi:Sodium, potassium, lithium and rubidium/H(+) antiporter [Clavibacter michiganensis]|uniref:Sodium, potassium, lithium and rubidium/H(+) antiporter n=1 Tax=Clavibacter michiganensis TaxID=28447 RepID=A0A251XTT4_9MICO|nr:Sodium, potassium, lithium and rubidium/H(+) antiporter [Clavibacter michiganensis]